MKEKTMRQVMIKYFASKGIKVIPSRGAGPDLIIDGKAVEVKGSRIDFERMLKQLLDYAYKYSDLYLALPFDGLNLKRAEQLNALASLIEHARDIRLKVYVVAPDSSHKNAFYVREYKKTAMVTVSLGPPNWSELGFHVDDPDSAIGGAVEKLTRYSPINQLRKDVCEEYLREVTKVKI